MPYFHIPVLSKEVIEIVDPMPGENLVDGTLGGGGHAGLFLEKISPDGKLLGIDLDDEALSESRKSLGKYSDRIILKKGNFVDFVNIVKEHNFQNINIFFLDLGFSSQQLKSNSVGISFLKEAPLDMRIGGISEDGDNKISAEDIVNNYKEEKIKLIIKEYGEERYATLIAREIIKVRKESRIVNTQQLVDLISKVVPEKYKKQKIHFATKTFQALRIAVNSELENLEIVLPQILDNIETGGRIAIISFHSLEDRIVKRFFQKESKDCICDLKVPVCNCGHKKRLEILTKKPIQAKEKEILSNSRARSAKLRIAKKI
ncbi:MAG: 16S rRNA (cytosine(1402)-N(4))-methyltransferase RsmH [Patescibacteria group bacterium]|nr:16S rRNA (cytosine(1402)-N(4))-methyltransferase RsmH [Patescibacteria group bacterium]